MNNQNEIILIQFLKKLRLENNVNLADVEKATELSKSYINRLEN